MAELIKYLPQQYRDILEFQKLTAAEDPEFDRLHKAVEQALDDKFVLTASESSIRRWEAQLTIRADTSAETLEFRRKRIINRLSTKPPFTERYLQERLDYLLGPGKAIVSIDVQAAILKITAKLTDAPLFKELAYTIRNVKPANLVYLQETALGDTILIEEQLFKTPLSRRTRLSTTWKLGSTPFATRNQEVQVK
ncbi:putative phage tail protein [Paenibacillus sp. FJAT-26967]|uniref:putative phage tail protein n=1 Tax=Paenibacillus sp. FJAT-26967 TaxID=1729690 RepID=UPI00083909A0|nr:putative phage tail protein [Paenibacillus sp. FJAT-26967]